MRPLVPEPLCTVRSNRGLELSIRCRTRDYDRGLGYYRCMTRAFAFRSIFWPKHVWLALESHAC